jgi:hypothetical protein
MRRRVVVADDLEAILSRSALVNSIRFPGVARLRWSHELPRWFAAPCGSSIINFFLLDRPLFLFLEILFQVASACWVS